MPVPFVSRTACLSPCVFKEPHSPDLFVIPDADDVSGWGEGIPGDVKPGGGGEELVGVLPCSEEVNESRKLRWVFRMDVGSLADQVLGIPNAAHLAIHSLAAEARTDDDRAHDKPGGL